MINRNILIGLGILILVALGLLFFSNMTGNVVTGSIINGEEVGNEYFKISEDVGNGVNEEVVSDGAQDIVGQG